MKIRFVVVDDAAFLRELVKNIIVDIGGLCVGEAADGDEAIMVAQSTLPDLIIMDMVMPQKNGIEAAKVIKTAHPDIKIVGCSTIDQEALINQAMAAGFDAYVTKPFTKEQLIKSISKVFPNLGESAHGRT